MRKFIPANPNEFKPLAFPRQLSPRELRAVALKWQPLRLVHSLPAPKALEHIVCALVVLFVVLV